MRRPRSPALRRGGHGVGVHPGQLRIEDRVLGLLDSGGGEVDGVLRVGLRPVGLVLGVLAVEIRLLRDSARCEASRVPERSWADCSSAFSRAASTWACNFALSCDADALTSATAWSIWAPSLSNLSDAGMGDALLVFGCDGPRTTFSRATRPNGSSPFAAVVNALDHDFGRLSSAQTADRACGDLRTPIGRPRSTPSPRGCSSRRSPGRRRWPE